MKKLTQKQIKERELLILKHVARICEKNNLRYFLAGGTLLGAVRHKGFIPWDDDIDIAMPRKDYNQLLEILRKDNSEYDVMTSSYNNDYFFLFSKILDSNTIATEQYLDYLKEYNLFIDIFILDGFGVGLEESKKEAKKLLFLRDKYYFLSNCIPQKIHSKNYLRKFVKLHIIYPGVKLFKKIFGQDVLFNFVNNSIKFDFDESEYVGSIIGGRKGLDELFHKKIYSEYEMMEFEGHMFRGMKYYDEYLTAMYGDYMKLPPENERVGGHQLQAWLKNDCEENQ
ncbi:MAG: LicD family protein [Clostridia bacterium]